MKADNLHKKIRLFNDAINDAIKEAERREKKGFYEGAALAYLDASKLLPENKCPKDIAVCFYSAGTNYHHAKKDDKASEFLLKALDLFENTSGKESLDVANTLNVLGDVCRYRKEFDKSEEYFKRALAIQEKTLGEEQIGTLNNLGNLYQDKNEFDKASDYYQQAKKAIKNLEINDDISKTITKNHLELKLENLRMRAAIHQADRLAYLGRMATMMAHNIKNPVNNITTATVSMLMGIKNKGITAEQLIPSLERILNNSDRLNKIIENFRNFAQGDRTTLAPINLNETIEDIFQLLFVGQYQNHQIKLIRNFSENPVIAKTNNFAIQEILVTLLNNAKEVLSNKESNQVTINTWQNGDKVGFDIEDNGGGIAEEKRDKLFSPFFSSKNSGMGLGLYFCKEILKDLEGNIDYYPAPHGAGFRVTLPIATEL